MSRNEVVGIEMLYLSRRAPQMKTTALDLESVLAALRDD